jgi:hypothetical protein
MVRCQSKERYLLRACAKNNKVVGVANNMQQVINLRLGEGCEEVMDGMGRQINSWRDDCQARAR